MIREMLLLMGGVLLLNVSFANSNNKKHPNVLVVMADDQSFPYTSIYGSNMVKTPNFDRLAKNGALFTNAYVTSPGCAPSRASILTGRQTWQLEEAGTHASSFPAKYKTYPTILMEAGYKIGFTGKGWAPGNWEVSGRLYNPAGPEYNDSLLIPPTKGISNVNYTANFLHFLQDRNKEQPFCFWLGLHEPHRNFEFNSGLKFGYKSLSEAEVPAFLPEADEIKIDLLDYAFEIEWFDKQLGNCLALLEKEDELENTIIIVSSDNGMPFPRAKANCYDAGLHVPLLIYWKNRINPQIIHDVFSTIHLMPTILDATLCQPLIFESHLTGKSILHVLMGQSSTSDVLGVAYSARERHTSARYNNLGYPVRSLRTNDFLIIRNFEPDRWPAGDPGLIAADIKTLEPLYNAFCDIDASPTKEFVIANRKKRDVRFYFEKAVIKRPAWELYDLQLDPYCLNNIAENKTYASIFSNLSEQLISYLKSTNDPRMSEESKNIFETYPRLVGIQRVFKKESEIENNQ